jgi:hypothetical protein
VREWLERDGYVLIAMMLAMEKDGAVSVSLVCTLARSNWTLRTTDLPRQARDGRKTSGRKPEKKKKKKKERKRCVFCL